ncbi:MAG: Lpg1974 family pore-forming outer membrane protein [Gemmataceae bacterium]
MRVALTLWVALGTVAAIPADEPPASLPPVTAPQPVPPPPPPPPPPPVSPPLAASVLTHPDLPPVDSPTLTMPTGPRPGLYGGIDFSLVVPHVSNDLRGTVFVPPIFVDQLRVPSAGLDGTLSPKFTLGYRLPSDWGAVAITYRNLASEGQDVVGGLDPLGDSTLFSRLDVNEVGIHYSSSEHPIGALWGIRWEVGARFSSIYFDSQAFGLILGQHTTNHFVGAGPQLALDVTRELPGTGLALFARGDFADMIGRINQQFSERVGDPAAPIGVGYLSQSGNQAVPYLGLQLGVSWLSHPTGRYRITAGYQFDQWWNVGKVKDSRADVQANGLFLRSEINF